ncbi:hypothetical protein [Geodermatophilus sp. SYSU D00700]
MATDGRAFNAESAARIAAAVGLLRKLLDAVDVPVLAASLTNGRSPR